MGYVQDAVIGLSEFAFNRTRERLAGLTDEEWLWEPTDWSWSVRNVGDTWMIDYATPDLPPSPTPVSTIAWRLAHVIANYDAPRNGTWLGLPAGEPQPVTGSAATELARLDVAAAWWHDSLRQTDDESLGTQIGPIGGMYADSPRLAFVLHEIDEQLHHSAEIGLLRDLYAARTTEAPPLATVHAAASAGRWDRVIALAEGGADVDGGAPFTPLHLAVAAGARPAVEVLLARGADPTVKDPQFDQDAMGWAQFFGRADLVALLSAR